MKVSYLVTLYNKSATIATVLKQIIAEIELFSAEDEGEIIIVDDGSTDDSSDIVSKLQSFNKGLIKLCHQQNQGVVAATNKAIGLATGDWLRFVDADDLVIIGSTKYLIKLGEEYSVGMVLSNVASSFKAPQIEHVASKKWDLIRQSKPFILEDSIRTSLRYTLCITSDILIKASIAKLLKMDPTIRSAQDHYICAIASHHCKILQSNCGSFLYCHGGDNSLSGNYLEMIASSFYIGLDSLSRNNWAKKDLLGFFTNFSARRVARGLRRQYGGNLFCSANAIYRFILMTILGRIPLLYNYKIRQIDHSYRTLIATKSNKTLDELSYPPPLNHYYPKTLNIK